MLNDRGLQFLSYFFQMQTLSEVHHCHLGRIQPVQAEIFAGFW